MRATGVASHDQRAAVVKPSNDLSAMAAALRADRRRRLDGELVATVMNHNVIYSRNVFATCQTCINRNCLRYLHADYRGVTGRIVCRFETRPVRNRNREVVKFGFAHLADG
jgi:hypothetical protein